MAFNISDVFKYSKLPPEQRLNIVLIVCFGVFLYWSNRDREQHFADDLRTDKIKEETIKDLRMENKAIREQNARITDRYVDFVLKSKTDIDTIDKKLQSLK